MAEDNAKQSQWSYQDSPLLTETFADTVGSAYFEGGTLRIEFLTTRINRSKGPGTSAMRKVPVCRLVLNANGAIELLNHCQQITTALEKAGVVKTGAKEKNAGDKAGPKSK